MWIFINSSFTDVICSFIAPSSLSFRFDLDFGLKHTQPHSCQYLSFFFSLFLYFRQNIDSSNLQCGIRVCAFFSLVLGTVISVSNVYLESAMIVGRKRTERWRQWQYVFNDTLPITLTGHKNTKSKSNKYSMFFGCFSFAFDLLEMVLILFQYHSPANQPNNQFKWIEMNFISHIFAFCLNYHTLLRYKLKRKFGSTSKFVK